jgi:hypothetical protein
MTAIIESDAAPTSDAGKGMNGYMNVVVEMNDALLPNSPQGTDQVPFVCSLIPPHKGS